MTARTTTAVDLETYYTEAGMDYRAWSRGFNMHFERFADLEAFSAGLERYGFEVEEREEISWRIAPSVMHVPWVTLKFLAGELFAHRGKMNRVRWGHVLACLAAPFIGLGRSYFGYYLVTARRR